MNLSEVYHNGISALRKAEVEDPAFDALYLFEHVFGLDRQALIVHGNEPAPQDQIDLFFNQIEQRAQKRPLQYILGKWEFLSLQLEMGEGVLIAREDTEPLVRTVAELLKSKSTEAKQPKILDLCGGTGAVALGLASLLPHSEITCIELYDNALYYLDKNINNYPKYHVTALKADVLSPESVNMMNGQAFDAIVSNPPYIKSDNLSTLQTEVKKEPQTALDGGADGLTFYRAIAGLWLPLLKQGGIAAVEIGEDEAEQVAAIFKSAGLSQISVYLDFNNLDRVVTGRKGS